MRPPSIKKVQRFKISFLKALLPSNFYLAWFFYLGGGSCVLGKPSVLPATEAHFF
jgi:hypothetical protein